MYKPFKVDFLDGPYNGAVRYYRTFSNVFRAARRYVKCPTGNLFSYPCCEIFRVLPSGDCHFLTVVLHD